jgi:hypothetical protein
VQSKLCREYHDYNPRTEGSEVFNSVYDAYARMFSIMDENAEKYTYKRFNKRIEQKDVLSPKS